MHAMSKSQRPATLRPRRTRRGTLARPLDALIFLLPLILFYEVASLARQERVVAFEALFHFFKLFGYVGVWAPGLAVVIILIATHVASGDRWAIHWDRVGWMYVESVAFSVPLLLLNWAVPLGPDDGVGTFIQRMALGIGAGIYEELVFRLIIISLIVILAADLLRLDRAGVAVAAVILSSLAFAAHHHRPIGVEMFDPLRFTFRAVAGVYLAVIFWLRGYGPAAGCHAAYNVALVVVTWLRS